VAQLAADRIKQLTQLRNASLSHRRLLEEQSYCENKLKESGRRQPPSLDAEELLLSGIEEEDIYRDQGNLFG
jgi:hypothetical protein